MLDPRFTYLTGALAFLAVWIFFWKQADKGERRLIVDLSVIMLVLGPVANYLWFLQDWWRPQTITGTLLGIEDLILSFTNSTIPLALGLRLFRKEKEFAYCRARLVWLVMAVLVFTGFFYYGLGWHSFLANTVAALIVWMFTIAMVPRALGVSVAIGTVLMIGVIPLYLVLDRLSPGWIDSTWYWDSICGIRFLNIPIEDLLWYFSVGLGFSATGIYAAYGSDNIITCQKKKISSSN